MKNYLLLGFCLFLALALAPLAAQSRKTLGIYNQARLDFTQKRYVAAMAGFQQVLSTTETNSLTQQARFFYALSAFKNQEPERAYEALLDLRNGFPDWEHIAEVDYTLAEIDFQRNKAEAALGHCQNLANSPLRNEAYQMKGFFLQKLSVAELENLLVRHNKDTLLAQCLFDKLATEGTQAEEYHRAEWLRQQYQLKAAGARRIAQVKYERIPYKVALLLPFEMESLEKRDTTALNRLATHLYSGALVAQQEMDTVQNIDIRCHAYDVRRDNLADLQKMIAEGEFDDMDLLIGPIFSEVYPTLARLSEQAGFQIIRPLNTERDRPDHPYTYQFLPSAQNQALATLQYFGPKTSARQVVIFYDRLQKNREWAEAFQKEAQAQGWQVRLYEEVKTVDLPAFRQKLAQLNWTQLGLMVMSSTSQSVASELLAYFASQGQSVPVVVPDAWLKFQEIDYALYEQNQVHFVYPDYYDEDTPAAVRFRAAFKNFTRQDPNQYAYIGYEIMHYFGRMLQQYGTRSNLANALSDTPARMGIVWPGINFRQSRDNAFVPILKINFGNPQLVNPISN
ncbi:MAG: hypothetical protein OHK0053_13450 [Microscillaceae bacterium]